MGRPPIGKRAMTATERQRRWRAKSRANKPAQKPAASRGLQARVRQLEADLAALRAAMGRLLYAIAQRPAASSKKARLVLDREFRAELARLRSDLARLDKGLDGRRLVVTVTGYRRHMVWLLDPDSNEVVGPLVSAHTRARAKAPTGNHAKARRGRASKAGVH
jgi:hypothetical protein